MVRYPNRADDVREGADQPQRLLSARLARLGALWLLSLLLATHGHCESLTPQPPQRTIDEAMARYAPGALSRLRPAFARARIAYPPTSVVLLALKRERTLEVWAKDRTRFRFITRYRVLRASGTVGPKLREGDRQVPEGRYRVVALNPNSAYHLSLKLDYPNAFDRLQARNDGRAAPGSDIFIHGKARSAGCLAMGDRAVEELFVMAQQTGIGNVSVVIAPRDPRLAPLLPLRADSPLPAWTAELYRRVEAEFSRFTH